MSNRPNWESSLFALACVFLFAGTGCGHHASGQAINHKAQVRKLSGSGYEVTLSCRITFRRPLFRWRTISFPFFSEAISLDYTNWLYLPRTNGTVDASNVVVMTDPRKTLAVPGMTGTVCFSNGMMTVNLNQTFRPVGFQSVNMLRYVPYGLNSTYQLE